MRLAIAILLLFVCLSSFAQSITIKGKIWDRSKSPLPFVSIAVNGKVLRSSSDANGQFSISIDTFPAVLQFSAVGFTTKSVKLSRDAASRELNVVMENAHAEMSEVVVVSGYSRKRSDAFSEPAAPPAKKDVASHSSMKLRRYAGDAWSNILTAGELSDFKKWKLWNDYSSAEFSSYSDEWDLVLTKRFCVQVQNENHRAAIGEKVYLINYTTKDTVWSAFTDNTGKAELWGDFNAEADEQSGFFISCGNQMVSFPVSFEKGVNRIQLKKPCSVSNIVDMAFVVDATGSMGDEIRYLQSELQEIIEKTSNSFKDVKLRVGSVFYRDHGDEYLTRHFDFQSDPHSVNEFINNQSAGGGGDFPEAVEDALQAALDKLSWSNDARTKIIFLVLDAPPHAPAKEKMKQLIRRAAATGIRIVPIACSGINKSTEYLLRCAALATNGSYVFLTDDSGIGNSHIKPTTDEFKVELLNELLQRVISEMIYVPSCNEIPKLVPTVDSTETFVKVKIYPNPSSGRIIIESTASLQQVYLADFAGKLLQRLDTRDRKRRWMMNLGNYPSATYLIKYFNENKGWGTEKIVLIH